MVFIIFVLYLSIGNIWKSKSRVLMSKRIAFITEEYSESEFSSGGVKLNYELILKLIDKGYSVDIFSKKYLIKNNIANNYFDHMLSHS